MCGMLAEDINSCLWIGGQERDGCGAIIVVSVFSWRREGNGQPCASHKTKTYIIGLGTIMVYSCPHINPCSSYTDLPKGGVEMIQALLHLG